jgi:hypothetical protein
MKRPVVRHENTIAARAIVVIAGLLGSTLLYGCGNTSSDNRALASEDVLRNTLVGLEEMGGGWEGLWDPTMNGDSPAVTDPEIEAALDRLSVCAGRNAPVFLTDLEPTVTGSTLLGPADEFGLQVQIDSHVYASRGVAADLGELVKHQDCLSAYTADRITASLDQPSLTVSPAVPSIITQGLPKGLVGIRFDLTISNASTSVPVSSTLLAGGEGSFAVFYDISTVGGPAPQLLVDRLAGLMTNKVAEVADAL